MNIWSIKNKSLRIAVAWPLAVATVAGMLVLLVGLVVFSAVVGAYRRIADEFSGSLDLADWRSMAVAAWAAMTGKDEPQ